MEDLISIIKLAAVFGIVMVFGFWQLRSLNKLDQEDVEREKRSQGKN